MCISKIWEVFSYPLEKKMDGESSQLFQIATCKNGL